MRALAIAAGVLGLAGALLLFLGHVVLPDARRPPPSAAGPTGLPSAVSPPAAATIASAPLLSPRTQREVSELVLDFRSAGRADIPELRRAALESPDPLVAGNALRALGRLGAVARDPTLSALVVDGRPRVRQEAVVALGLDGDPAGVPVLERVLEGGERALRPLVLQALGRIGSASARELVQRAAADPSSTAVERAFALAAL